MNNFGRVVMGSLARPQQHRVAMSVYTYIAHKYFKTVSQFLQNDMKPVFSMTFTQF